MAEIILAPGEIFEHYHREESVTELARGRLLVTMGEIAREVRRGEALVIPATTAHTMTNIGRTKAVVRCYHRPAPAPAPPQPRRPGP